MMESPRKRAPRLPFSGICPRESRHFPLRPKKFHDMKVKFCKTSTPWNPLLSPLSIRPGPAGRPPSFPVLQIPILPHLPPLASLSFFCPYCLPLLFPPRPRGSARVSLVTLSPPCDNTRRFPLPGCRHPTPSPRLRLPSPSGQPSSLHPRRSNRPFSATRTPSPRGRGT